IGFEIANNTIVQSSGRGIGVSGNLDDNSPGPNTGTVHDNFISVRESRDAGEYQGQGDGIGIILRFGAHNIQVYNNNVCGYAGANAAPVQFPTSLGNDCQCIGIKVDGGTNGAGNQVYNNTVLVSTTDASLPATGLYGTGTSDGSKVFHNNTVTSNSLPASINGSDGGGSNFMFASNTFIEGANPQGFHSIQGGGWWDTTGNIFLDNTWEGGASYDDVA